MKTAVYFCNCGTNVTEKVDPEKVKACMPGGTCFKTIDFMCAEEGLAQMQAHLEAEKPDRVVVAACSPRDHELTFRRVCSNASVNPYLMQMVNIREQVAWVTADPVQATEKATRYIRAAVARTARQEPLEDTSIDVRPEVLVIGAGPAGLKAAQTLAESGRHVTIVEKSPAIGGLPVLYEEIAPNMECGSCMLEPLLGEVLHGKHAHNIELLTLSEVEQIVGYYGNFTARIKRNPRYVDAIACIGCGECIPVCPASTKNEFNCGLSERRAIDFPYPGALPNLPFLDASACGRSRGDDCQLCRKACPVSESVIDYGESAQVVERSVGAILAATGASLYDCGNLPNLGYGTSASVRTSIELERLMASNGPTAGALVRDDGAPPRSVAIVHCVGSLDSRHKEYCSAVCCSYAFKFNHVIETKLPSASLYHLYKEIVLPGKEDAALYRKARENPRSTFIRYKDISDLRVADGNGGARIEYRDAGGVAGTLDVDTVVLCPAIVPSEGVARLARALDAPLDRTGFFEELHSRTDSAQSKLKGIYLAGTCQSPMNIQQAMNQGMAAAGYVLAGLREGQKLEIEPVKAAVDEGRCSGCRVCGLICPYQAISIDAAREVASVNTVLCQGCGTCVAACPAGAITGHHFTDAAIMAEIAEVLA